MTGPKMEEKTSVDEKEAAATMALLFTSPGCLTPLRPKAGQTPIPPPLALALVAATEKNHLDQTKARVLSLKKTNRKKLASLVSALESELPAAKPKRSKVAEEQVELLPRLRSQRKSKRRASVSIIEHLGSKRRAISVDSEAAASEPGFGGRRSPKYFGSCFLYTSEGEGRVGIYNKAERKKLIANYLEKRRRRVWKKQIKYKVRKKFADSRLRVKGRFISKDDEGQLREALMTLLL